MQQKVQFISTVLHEPQLVILDEAFAGLDPVNTQVLKDTVLGLARGGTAILFSTHILEQAERHCDSVSIIAAGVKVVDGRLSEVKGSYHDTHVALAVEWAGVWNRVDPIGSLGGEQGRHVRWLRRARTPGRR